MKEIIISMYDYSWNWSIFRTEENGTTFKVNEEDDLSNLTIIEKVIYENMIRFNSDVLTKDKIIKQLTEYGYRIIICEDGDIELYEQKENKNENNRSNEDI